MLAFCVVAKLKDHREQVLSNSQDPEQARIEAEIARRTFKDDPDIDEVIVEHRKP